MKSESRLLILEWMGIPTMTSTKTLHSTGNNIIPQSGSCGQAEKWSCRTTAGTPVCACCSMIKMATCSHDNMTLVTTHYIDIINLYDFSVSKQLVSHHLSI